MSERWKPHGYQKKAVAWLLKRGAAGLFLDPGLGKTSIVLAALKILKREKMIRSALVVAPLRVVHSVWPAEMKKWEDFHGLTVTILHGPEKDKNIRRTADVYLINPEGLTWFAARVASKAIELPDVLVIDESTKFKHTQTLRFKILKPLLRKFRRRYILTGTPTPNGLIDLFGQMYIVDQGAALGPYVTKYRNEYFSPTGYGGFKWVPQKDATERIYQKISPLILRLDEKDYLELPPKVVTDVMIDLPKKARELYDKLERELVLRLKEGSVTIANAAVLTSKTRQIASGAIYLSDQYGVRKPGYHEVHEEKLDALVDLIDELSGQPALVAYEFVHERDRILARLPKGTPYIGGGVSGKRGREIEEAFGRGEVPVLLCHPASAGHGLNLQAGRAVIFYSPTWDLELYDQTIRRVHRQGQKKKVFVYRIVARNTIDRIVLRGVEEKAKGQAALLNMLREEYL